MSSGLGASLLRIGRATHSIHFLLVHAHALAASGSSKEWLVWQEEIRQADRFFETEAIAVLVTILSRYRIELPPEDPVLRNLAI